MIARQVNHSTNPHLAEVLHQAERELRQLLEQKAELMRRIGTIRQTIVGLANLIGDERLRNELLQTIEGTNGSRRPGFTKACRMALMETRRAMTAPEVCDWIRQKDPAMLSRHKDPIASVTTVMNRLVAYGEAQSVGVHSGRRGWQWLSEVQLQNTEREQRLSAG